MSLAGGDVGLVAAPLPEAVPYVVAQKKFKKARALPRLPLPRPLPLPRHLAALK